VLSTLLRRIRRTTRRWWLGARRRRDDRPPLVVARHEFWKEFRAGQRLAEEAHATREPDERK
jgi:hypothetical protein